MEDATLLHRYAHERDQAAFTELVNRHVNLVYFAALRRTSGDSHRAEEVAQAVFVQLARKAAVLARHPALTGWLHTAALLAAREAIRAESRRQARERQAEAMKEIFSDAPREVPWDEVRPVIDDALRDLHDRDREALLLRFFENRRYAEIGAALRITENSARMRVERALEKLREALGRRGVGSTTAALTAALAVPSSMAAPAGLAQQIASAAMTAAAAAGAGAGLLSVLQLMTSAKLIALSTGTVAALALGFAVQQHHQLGTARQDVVALQQKQQQLQALVDNLEGRLAAAHERLAQANDTPAAAAVLAAPASSAAVPPVAITRDMVEARHKRAKELAKAGRHEEALREYLWCYDTGMRRVDGYFITRYAPVLDQIAELGKSYPPAREALRVRRDAAEVRLRASATDMEAGKDFNQLNRVLGENDRTFAVFDSLPEDDPRRQHIVDTNIQRLMEAQRYRELAKAMPYTSVPQVWEQMTQLARAPSPSEEARLNRQRNVIRFATDQIELRAGAGELVHASDLIERVLIFDNSAETVASIKQHLERAGHPELLDLPGS